MRSPSEMAEVLVSLSYRVIGPHIERLYTGDLVSEKEGKIIDGASKHAHTDGLRGPEKTFRVIEYYIDCGTRENGWNIGVEGPSRAEWERFKRESPFYQQYHAGDGNKAIPDISAFQLPPFSANKELFASILSK